MLQTTVQGEVNMLGLIQDGIKTGGTLAATLRLYNNDVTPSRTSVVADFVEANFTGYAALPLALTVGPYLNAAQQAEIQNASHNWTPSDDVTPNVIYGYFVEMTGGDLLCAERFTTPRSMENVLDSLTLVPSFILLPGGIAGNNQPIDS
jgi:hypothetical protein